MKRGQDAGGVAIFVILLAIFIIIYVLLAPVEERERLLGIEEGVTEEKEIGNEQVILSVEPGKVTALEKSEYSININPISLYSRIEEESIKLADSLKIAKGLFKEEFKSLSFTLDKDVEELKLFFFIKSGKGDLIIELNGNIVYEGKITSTDVPIDLPKTYLRKNNILKFKTGFFDKYELINLNLKQWYKTQKTKSVRTFELTSSEKTNLRKIKLNYLITCISVKEQGRLKIYLNRRLISDDYVRCDVGVLTQDLSPDYFVAGTNTLDFEIDKGDYELMDMELKIESVEKFFPKYYFELESDVYEDIEKDKSDIFLELFLEETGQKKATIALNKEFLDLNTKGDYYTSDISDYIRRGSNTIKIVPAVDFEIEEMTIFLKPK